LIAGNAVNALALINEALDQCREALPVLSAVESSTGFSPRSIIVTKDDVRSLHELLSRELQRTRALVEIFNLRRATAGSVAKGPARPLVDRLTDYPVDGVDLCHLVSFPPKLEVVPVKPIFLDVAWNYIEYPVKGAAQQQQRKEQASAGPAQPVAEETKPQKKGWFGFGR